MEHFPAHILLCGSRRSGRSSMIRALLQSSALPAYGFMTRSMNTLADGYHEIYMFPYGDKAPLPAESCHIGDCNTRERTIHTEVFNTLGVELLKARGEGILVMDELGFMEAGAADFCRTVLDRLEGGGHVLAAVRTSIETPFLRQVLACEKARVVEMCPERFGEIYAELVTILEAWG